MRAAEVFLIASAMAGVLGLLVRELRLGLGDWTHITSLWVALPFVVATLILLTLLSLRSTLLYFETMVIRALLRIPAVLRDTVYSGIGYYVTYAVLFIVDVLMLFAIIAVLFLVGSATFQIR